MRERERERQRERQRETARQTDRQTDREREGERDRQRERERETERQRETSKIRKLLGFKLCIALACLFYQVVIFPHIPRKLVTINESLTTWLYIYFHFHYRIELFAYLIQLISEWIQEFGLECNFCNMHCSLDKQNYIQLNPNDLTPWSFRTDAASIIFHLSFSVDVNVVSEWRWQIIHLEASKIFIGIS